MSATASPPPSGRVIQWAFVGLVMLAFGFVVLQNQNAHESSTIIFELTQCCARTPVVHSEPTIVAPPQKSGAVVVIPDCIPPNQTSLSAAPTASPPTAAAAPTPAIEDLKLLLLRARLVERLEDFKQQHIDAGRPHAVGLRGVSWIHKNLNGALIASPDVAAALLNADENGTVTIRFKDISEEQLCPPDMANLVSIYVRLSGPELLAVLAQSVAGKCEWEAKLQVSIPGQYTVLARLLHYNGGADVEDDCEVLQPQNLASTNPAANKRIKLLHAVPRYPFFAKFADCHRMCARHEQCAYAMDLSSDGNPCYMFSEAKQDATEPGTFLISEVYANIGHTARENRGPGVCRKSKPFDKLKWVWHLGCGREEMLMRWATCAGLNETKTGRRMKGVEDMILFEYEHAQLAVPLLGVNPALVISADQAQLAFDQPTLPTCTPEQLRQHMPSGRWTRSPNWRTEKCGPFSGFKARNAEPSPLVIDKVDPICNLRFEMDKLAQRASSTDPLTFAWDYSYPYFEVWKSELSDLYFHAPESAHNHADLWTGYFRLPPQAECAMPPPLPSQTLRECMLTKNVDLHAHGDSITEFFVHFLGVQLKHAFPEQAHTIASKGYDFFPPAAGASSGSGGSSSSSTPVTKRSVFMSDFFVPNAMLLETLPKLRERFAAQDMRNLVGITDKVFLTPPFAVWERRMGLTAERVMQASQAMRDVLLPLGWKEVDLNRLSREWIFDATPERDSLHVVGHSMYTAVQLFLHLACSTNNSSSI